MSIRLIACYWFQLKSNNYNVRLYDKTVKLVTCSVFQICNKKSFVILIQYSPSYIRDLYNKITSITTNNLN